MEKILAKPLRGDSLAVAIVAAPRRRAIWERSVKIVGHTLVRGAASPDDASLREYWWERRKINVRHLSRHDVLLAESQDWRCPVCGMDLINGEELHRHHKKPRSMGGADSHGNRELLHLYCHQQRHAMMARKAADELLDTCRE